MWRHRPFRPLVPPERVAGLLAARRHGRPRVPSHKPSAKLTNRTMESSSHVFYWVFMLFVSGETTIPWSVIPASYSSLSAVESPQSTAVTAGFPSPTSVL